MTRAWISLTAVVLAGCTANPQPVPLPMIRAEAVLLGHPTVPRPSVLVAGRPGAIVEGGALEVEVHNRATEQRVRRPVANDGSFFVLGDPLQAVGIEITAWRGTEAGPSLLIKPPDVLPPDLPPVLAVQSTTRRSAELVELAGTTDGTIVVAGSLPRSLAVTTSPPAGGAWTLQIAAATGDELLVFAVKSELSSPPVRVAAP